MNDLKSVCKSSTQNIHFVGIGGSGMSGIAEVLHNLGYQISGSDLSKNKTTERLAKMGCKINYSHDKNHVDGAHAVVVSSAIDENNPELIRARELNIAIVPRAEMLSELMRFRFGIAVAGTHGKTTTTSLIAHILNTANLDPTYIIGGILNSSGINAKLGESDYLVAEADESDASFLHLQPMLSVITNIDQDHMGTYQHNEENLHQAFISFTSNLPFYGTCIACADDLGVASILADVHRPVVTYGLNKGVDVQAQNITQENRQMYFDVVCKKQQQNFSVVLNLIGRHNVLNTLAAIAVACELKISAQTIQKALSNFSGVSRRLDYHGQIQFNKKIFDLYDDYGHHPNEIRAVFESLKHTYPKRRLLVVFQPHRYTRTQDLFDDFAWALSDADALILTDIYPASEKPIANINSNVLADSIRLRCSLDPIVVKNTQQVVDVLKNLVENNDVVLTLGAGDIHKLPSLITQYGI